MKKKIGLVLHNLHEEFSLEISKGVERFCNEKSYSLILLPICPKYSEEHNFEYRNRAILKLINNHNLDGIIYCASSLGSFESKTEVKKDIDALAPLPIVNIGMHIQPYPYVRSESKNAFKNMLLHIIEEHKKTKFLLITSHDENEDSKKRKEWFLEVLKEKNLTIDDSKIINAQYNRLIAKRSIQSYVSKNGLDFECVVCLNDAMALGAINGLQELNYSIPKDVIVTGYDNTKKAFYSIPSLTTIDPGLSNQGYQAAVLLEEVFNNNKSSDSAIIQASEKFRISCGCVSEKTQEIDYIDYNKNIYKLSDSDIYKKVHFNQLPTTEELYILHYIIQKSLAVLNQDELFQKLPKYIEYANLQGLAIFVYEKPLTYTSTKKEFDIPTTAKRIFSYESSLSNDTLKANLDIEYFNPLLNAIPENTFKTDFQKTVIIPIFEDIYQYGYLVAPLGDKDPLFYQTVLEFFSKEVVSAIKITNVQEAQTKLESTNKKLKIQSSKLDTLSMTDELTSIYNRRGFMFFANKLIKNSISNGKDGLIIFCDMDGLKKINDTYGHEAGDRAIILESQILQKAVRSTDIVARFAGDEFAIAIKGAPYSFFETFKNRVKEESQKLLANKVEEFEISVSAGVAIFDKNNTNLTDLLNIADKELYKAKALKKKQNN